MERSRSRFPLAVSKCLAAWTLLLALPAAAQVCNSTGADGALTMTAPGDYDFDPVAAGLNAAGDNVFHFTTITIGQRVRLHLRAKKMKSPGPVVFLASGAVTIAGSLSVAGADGHNGLSDFSQRSPSEPGPGGYAGGAGGKPGSIGQAGAGPGGGGAREGLVLDGCPAAFAGQPAQGTLNRNTDQSSNRCSAGASYGNVFLQPLIGGSGGSGGTVPSGTSTAGGGGAGGGAIRICSDNSITIPAPAVGFPFHSIDARGGNGGTGRPGVLNNEFIEGGPGSGGAIHLQAPLVNLSGGYSQFLNLMAMGGSSNFNRDVASSGRIRIDANNAVNLTAVYPLPAVGPFRAVPLPPLAPTVRVLSVQGVGVTAFPANNPASPDVSVSAAGPVAIEVETANIPNGTTARFHVSTGVATPDLVQDATVAVNRATVNVTLPQGVHRLLVRATF